MEPRVLYALNAEGLFTPKEHQQKGQWYGLFYLASETINNPDCVVHLFGTNADVQQLGLLVGQCYEELVNRYNTSLVSV